MKILHAPTNIGGMPYTLARAQRELGYKAVSYCMNSTPFGYEADVKLDICNNKDKLKAILNIFKFAFKFNVFHFYFSESLAKGRLYDVPFLKALGKKIFFYFCGCDIRNSKEVIAKYEFSGCKNCWPMLCSANRDKAYRMAERYADAIFVSTPDLIEFVPDGKWLPQPIDLEMLQNMSAKMHYQKRNNIITVAHAPTNRNIKGSEFVIKAVNKLKKRGHKIELNLIENLPYQRALEEYIKADIVIDQLLIGWYGLVSIEMMALKKPAICYIREDLYKYIADDIPLISANIHNLAEVLENLIKNRDSWREIGEKGKLFVEKYHDSKKVAKIALEVYKNAS